MADQADPITLRRAMPDDVEALAALSGELGYPVAVDSLRVRLEALAGRPDHRVVVACDRTGAVVGWIHGAEQTLLETATRCEILGLVVSSRVRRQGIGHRLLSTVEAWAAERGVKVVSVRSNVVRVDSHPYYEKRGYVREKTQHAYRKRLEDSRKVR